MSFIFRTGEAVEEGTHFLGYDAGANMGKNIGGRFITLSGRALKFGESQILP